MSEAAPPLGALEISVIIPVYNGAATLGEQLSALVVAVSNDASVEVVVADNGSTDGTMGIAESYSRLLPLTVLSVPLRGANAARNAAVRASRGRFLLFCDADDAVHPDWIVRMRRALLEGHDVVAGRLDYRALNPPGAVSWRGAPGIGVHTPLGFLPAGHLCNMGVPRSVYERVGGLDESFVGGGDDIDFCWRVQLDGGSFHYAEDVVVDYRLRPSLIDMMRQESAYGAAEAQLYRAFRREGVQRRSARAVLNEVVWLITRLPGIVIPGRRGGWLRKAARQFGRLKGALIARTWWW